MSVPTDARSEAEPQFVITSRQLVIYTIGRYNSFSNKLNKTVGSELVSTAWVVFNNAFYAQKIKVSSKKTYEQRIDYLATASRAASSMAPKIEIAQEIITNRYRELCRQASKYKDNKENMPKDLMKELSVFEKAYNTNWEYWSNLIRDSIKLINGVARSDKKRYKGFQ